MKSTVVSPKPAKGLVQTEHAGRRQGESGTDGDHLDRQLVPDEQGDHGHQHQVDDAASDMR